MAAKLNALIALLMAGCAGAADGGDDLGEESPVSDKTTTTSVSVEWRTCRIDGDCALRASICAPLGAGETIRFCRMPRLEAGESCTGDDACEPGLACVSVNASVGTAHHCAAGATNRTPLSCSPNVFTVDAACEVLTD